MNTKTARSQVIGGVTWGIGYALMEHTVYDPRSARVVNPTLSTYLIPVNADVPEIESMFIDRPDPGSWALGARGLPPRHRCEPGPSPLSPTRANASRYAGGTVSVASSTSIDLTLDLRGCSFRHAQP
jgi:hypothetical protein